MSFNEQQIHHLQKAWADGVIDIGAAYSSGDDYRALGQQFVEESYLIDPNQPLLFKPTKATSIPFRPDLASAVSYFVSGDDNYPEDKGFALQPWIKIEFDNNNMLISDDIAVCIGEYYFTDKQSQTTKVEYSFGYKLNSNGQPFIFLHHSSLPYSG